MPYVAAKREKTERDKVHIIVGGFILSLGEQEPTYETAREALRVIEETIANEQRFAQALDVGIGLVRK
jgi:metal-dependent hydrolase (beta-lactamase superfamily II)